MSIEYGQRVVWSDLSGNVVAVEASGCSTPQEALHEAIASAKAMGWKPPRWWQWWRWDEPVRACR